MYKRQTKNADGACDGFPAGTPIDSDSVTFQPFTLNAPDLADVGILCVKDSGGIAVSWDSPWRGYGDSPLQLELSHVIAGETFDSRTVFDILSSDTGYFFDSIEPVGSYEVTLSAGGDEASCVGGVIYSPSISLGAVVAAVGEPSFEIPIAASGLSSAIEALEFELVIPETIPLLSPALEQQGGQAGEGDGFKRITVSEGDLVLDSIGNSSEVVLARLQAELPAVLPQGDLCLLYTSPSPRD